MTALLIFLQADLPNWGALGVGGVLAGVVFYFYRQDRLGAEQRYEALASDFRQVITENTAASTALRDAIRTVANCPYAAGNGNRAAETRKGEMD